MLDYHWKFGLCDLCRWDDSVLQSRLVGVMENGHWVGGFTREKCEIAKSIRAEWEMEISCQCLVLRADMEVITLCERHLMEMVHDRRL